MVGRFRNSTAATCCCWQQAAAAVLLIRWSDDEILHVILFSMLIHPCQCHGVHVSLQQQQLIGVWRAAAAAVSPDCRRRGRRSRLNRERGGPGCSSSRRITSYLLSSAINITFEYLLMTDVRPVGVGIRERVVNDGFVVRVVSAAVD
jgi:hypothetical protein